MNKAETPLDRTETFTLAHNALNMVDMLLVEAGFKQDSSIRHNLCIAKSQFREAEAKLETALSLAQEEGKKLREDAERWNALINREYKAACKETHIYGGESPRKADFVQGFNETFDAVAAREAP